MHNRAIQTGDLNQLLSQLDELQAEVVNLRAQLEHQERLATLGTIAGLIAHEFNNILTPVISYAQLSQANPRDAELASKAIARCLSGSQRAADIAAAILGFVRDDEIGLKAQTRSGGMDDRSDQEVPRGTSVLEESEDRATRSAPARRSDAHAQTKKVSKKKSQSRSSCANEVPRGTDSQRAVGARAGCDVGTAVRGALACLARSPEKDGITLSVEVPETCRAMMKSVALQHVLLNIVLNARNAMMPGGGRLSIRATCAEHPPRVLGVAGEVLAGAAQFRGNMTGSGGYTSRSLAEQAAAGFPQSPGTQEWGSRIGGGAGAGTGRWVQIEVEDTGRGMSPERLARVFEPFYSAGAGGVTGHGQQAGAAGSRGTGLGMTICQRLVLDAGGRLIVRSEPGRGTTVLVGLRAA
jgi:signal transduction histidine kinase